MRGHADAAAAPLRLKRGRPGGYVFSPIRHPRRWLACRSPKTVRGNAMKIAHAAALAMFSAATFASAEILEVSGATTVQRRILEPGAAPLKAATGIELKIYGPGTGKGMLSLI